MRFNPKARLDRSQVQVRRGGGGRGGGMPLPIPSSTGGRVGGGIGGLDPGPRRAVPQRRPSPAVAGGSGGSAAAASTPRRSRASTARRGQDANSNEQCALVADVNSVQAFWGDDLPGPGRAGVHRQRHGDVLAAPPTPAAAARPPTSGRSTARSTRRSTSTRPSSATCSRASSAPRAVPFAEAYVLAHEYGHHVQDLLGTMSKVRTQQGPTSDSVRLELQADCYAGIWAKNATDRRGRERRSSSSSTSPRRTSPARSTRPRRSVTTASSSGRSAGSTPTSGPTAPPARASTGSRSACARAPSRPATPSAPTTCTSDPGSARVGVLRGRASVVGVRAPADLAQVAAVAVEV